MTSGPAQPPGSTAPQPSGAPPPPPLLPPPAPPPPPPAPEDGPLGWLSMPEMRYPSDYVWFIFFSSLDIMLTWAILSRGGSEVNPIADEVIDIWGLPGAIIFKFSLTVLVIIVCEVVARQ